MAHSHHLIVIAGPSCIGKSIFIKGIQEKRFPLLSEQLGLDSPTLWEYVEYSHMKDISKSNIERLIIHLAFWLFRSSYQEIGGLEVLSTSRQITFVTLWTDSKTLLKRLKKRRNQILMGFLKSSAFRDRLQRLNLLKKRRLVYLNQPLLSSKYAQWFKFCNRYNPKAHWIADVTGSTPNLIPLSEWIDKQGIFI